MVDNGDVDMCNVVFRDENIINGENNTMADSKTRPLSPKLLQDDLNSFAALKAIGGYKPSNAVFELAKGDVTKSAMDSAQTKSIQDAATAAASRDDAVAGEWAFHDFITGAKTQVKAQFGDSSNEVQAMGLKKKSEYKKAGKKKTP